MPERNIICVNKDFSSPPQYYGKIRNDTGELYHLEEGVTSQVYVKIVSLMNFDGKIERMINKNYIFKLIQHEVLFGIQYWIIFSSDFMKETGVRKFDYLDLEINKIKCGTNDEEDVFPKLLVNGIFEAIPLDIQNMKLASNDLLIDNQYMIDESYYEELIMEINHCYGYGLYRSNMILIRLIFENLLI